MKTELFFLVSAFLDPTRIGMMATIIVLLIVFVVLIFISAFSGGKLENFLEKNDNSPLHLCYDIKTDQITAFFENKAHKVMTYSFDEFFRHLNTGEREKIRTWMVSFKIKDERTPRFLRANLQVPSGTKTKVTGGLFELNDVNADRSKVYTTLYQLHFIPFDQTKWQNNYNGVVRHLSVLINENKKNTGLYFINLSLINDLKELCSKDPVSYTIFVDHLFREAEKHKHVEVFELDADLILIVDLAKKKHYDFENAARYWLKTVYKIINVNNWEKEIKASMGVILSKDTDNGTRALVEEGRKLALSVEDVPSEKEAFLMYKNVSLLTNTEKSMELSFKKILSGRGISYLFQPIINPGTSRIMGYATSYKINDFFFKDLNEIKSYANRHQDAHELFVEYVSACIRNFEGEKEKQFLARLFIDINWDELETATIALPHISIRKDINVVFVLDEADLDEEIRMSDFAIKQIRDLKTLGFEIAFRLAPEQTIANYDLFKRFNYFIVPNMSRESRGKEDGRIQIYYTRLLERLLKFKRPAIAIDTKTWFMVELLTRLGIDYISSPEISDFSPDFKAIDGRKISKLSKYAE